jgi:hypothetical protein
MLWQESVVVSVNHGTHHHHPEPGDERLIFVFDEDVHVCAGWSCVRISIM